MNIKFVDLEKKWVAMRQDREDTLSVILPQAMGALRSGGLPYFDYQKSVYLQTQCCNFHIWARSKPQFIYLKIGYRDVYSVLHIRLFSNGSGDLLDRRASVVRWDRSDHLWRWQFKLFDAFPRDDDWFLSVQQEIFVPNAIKSLH